MRPPGAGVGVEGQPAQARVSCPGQISSTPRGGGGGNLPRPGSAAQAEVSSTPRDKLPRAG